jgi:hypothetical protein
MSGVKPHKIAIDDSKLEQLKQKLAFADFPDEIGGVEWSRGARLADIQRLSKY